MLELYYFLFGGGGGGEEGKGTTGSSVDFVRSFWALLIISLTRLPSLGGSMVGARPITGTSFSSLRTHFRLERWSRRRNSSGDRHTNRRGTLVNGSLGWAHVVCILACLVTTTAQLALPMAPRLDEEPSVSLAQGQVYSFFLCTSQVK